MVSTKGPYLQNTHSWVFTREGFIVILQCSKIILETGQCGRLSGVGGRKINNDDH
jgi:hypothetical protein